jgi:hypothetical protein
MPNKIKNFIEEGSELREFLTKEVETIYDMVSIMNPQSKAEFVAVALPNLATNTFHRNNSRQISLIKMIVEMVESEKKKEYLYHDEDFHSNHECDVLTHNQALDTISSKLKALIKE